MGETADVIVIGAGIAGASCAGALADSMRVLLLEREDTPGYHTTGRSAAMYIESYGPPTVRRLTRAGRSWFENPPAGFTDVPLLSPCGVLWIACEAEGELTAATDEAAKTGSKLERISAADAKRIVPILREDTLIGALMEADAMAMDVAAIHQIWLKRLRRFGGRIKCRCEVTGLDRQGADWTVRAADGRRFTAPVVVNAAGAWADVVAGLANVRKVGLQPKRRTLVTIDLPAGIEPSSAWPVAGDLGHSFYFKRDAGHLILSPADETASEPCDAQPEDLDIAIAIDRLQRATTLTVKQRGRAWAGLRSFVPDGELVVGYDRDAPGFFWLAGQGGYGIQTSAGAARLSAALIKKEPVPADLAAFGVEAAAMSPNRFG